MAFLSKGPRGRPARPTNIERVHGSYASHERDKPKKVEFVRALCLKANPDLEVVAIDGTVARLVKTSGTAKPRKADKAGDSE